MKLNTNLIIGAALIGGGAYYAYKQGWFGKKEDNAKKAEEKSQAELDRIAAEQEAQKNAVTIEKKIVSDVKQATSPLNPKSFAGKVAFIQQKLGCGLIDGNPGTKAGSETNLKYAAKYGLDKGIISTSNIDYYKEKVEKNLTLVAQKAAAKNAATGIAIVNALKKGGSIRFVKSINAQNFILNKATNSYVATGTNLLFNNGAVLSSSWRGIDRGNGYLLIYKQGAKTLQQVPVNAIVIV